MCFSASASFSAATVLTAAGYFAVKKTTSRSQVAFAAIPFMFAVQQFAEGIFWLTSTNTLSPAWEAPAVFIFLVFAQVVWPAWVPFSVYSMESVKPKRKSIGVFLAAGTVLALYHFYCLLVFPVHAEVHGYHVAYSLNFPSMGGNLTGVLYVLVTVVPLFISSGKRTNALGLTILLSFIITFFFYTHYLISVWCFFAAVISAMLVWVLADRNSPVHLTEKQGVH